jgi:hypothetical protein
MNEESIKKMQQRLRMHKVADICLSNILKTVKGEYEEITNTEVSIFHPNVLELYNLNVELLAKSN